MYVLLMDDARTRPVLYSITGARTCLVMLTS